MVIETGVEKLDSFTIIIVIDQSKNIKYCGITIGTDLKSCQRLIILQSNETVHSSL